MTDAEWALLEPLLPDRVPRRGGRWNNHRRMIDGVLWRTRTGAPWRDRPASYGNWKSVYSRHRRWSGDGTWEKVLDRLRTGCDQDEGREWTVGIDSSVVRAHQHAAGARHAPPQDIPAHRLAPLLPEPDIDAAESTADMEGASPCGVDIRGLGRTTRNCRQSSWQSSRQTNRSSSRIGPDSLVIGRVWGGPGAG